MPRLEYVSEGGYHYRQERRSARVVRIPKITLPAVISNPPKVGDHVKVIVKPYHERRYVTGIVRRVLTRKMRHTRGFKVMLESGVVGRMVQG